MLMSALLPLGLAFIMFAMGLTLVPADFLRIFRQPLALGTGLAVQIVLLPALAFGLLNVLPLPAEFAIGVMILAACPGGITSNFLTHISRGDTALSISMTAMTNLIGMISIPFVTGLALHVYTPDSLAPISVWRMILGIFTVSTLPVLAGMVLNRLRPRFTARMEPHVQRLAVVLFIGIVIAAFASQWTVMAASVGQIGPVVALLNILVMAIGYALATSLRFPRSQAIAISLEGGLQNGAVGIFVAMTLLHEPKFMVPSITYALVMNLTAAIFIAIMLGRRRQQAL